MNPNQLTEIGTIKRAHGLHGELKANIDSFYKEQLASLDALFLKKEDSFLPFFIESMELKATTTIIKFDSFSNKEEVTPFNGQPLYASTDRLEEVKPDESAGLTGLTLKSHTGEIVGVIEEIIDMPTQLLLKLFYKENEVLIPFHEDFVIERTDDTLTYRIPDGLLAIYS